MKMPNKPSRVCILCVLLGFVSSLAHAMSFSFENGSIKFSPTNNRPWGNIGHPKPGIPQNTAPAATYNFSIQRAAPGNNYTNSYSYSYSWSTSRSPAQTTENSSPISRPYSPMDAFSRTLGLPASYPGYGRQQIGYPSVQTGSYGSATPRVETEISEKTLYQQQSAIYTVRVVSDVNIRTLDTDVPRVEGAALEKLDGPIARARRAANGRQEIVNEYRYALTPIRSGEITIQPFSFSGSLVSGQGWPSSGSASGTGGVKPFAVSARSPLTMDVQPASKIVQPWLPLHRLRIQGQLQPQGSVEAGKPVTFTVELEASGAMGEQLPSIEGQLRNTDFRVYRESSTTKWDYSRDGKELIGRRLETYTLIPLRSGKVRLPEISVAWFNVDTGRAETATLAGNRLSIRGGTGIGEGIRDLVAFNPFPSVSSISFWIPILLIMGMVIGYWLGAWGRTRALILALWSRAVNVARPIRNDIAGRVRGTARSVRKVVAPVTWWQEVRMYLAMALPMPVRLWLCTRCLDGEDNPKEWCRKFKTLACRHLQISSQTPMQDIAERIIRVHPRPEPAHFRELAYTLDSAIYGDQPLDFESWKRAFGNEMRPKLFRQRRRDASGKDRGGLPELNPRAAA
jgi:hypothetical protein